MCISGESCDIQANGSAEPEPSREDYKLSRLCECGREKQPDQMDPLEKASARQSTGMTPC